MRGRVLIVAGSDSGGGAGIQGDIKTVTALGGYAATAITALTAQNTQGVFGVHLIPPDFIALQMRLVLEDIGANAIKDGMLHSSAVIAAVRRCGADVGGVVELLLRRERSIAGIACQARGLGGLLACRIGRPTHWRA